MNIRSYLGAILMLLASIPLLALAIHQLTHLTLTLTETTGTIVRIESYLDSQAATTDLLQVQFRTTDGELVTFSQDASTISTMEGSTEPYGEGTSVRLHYYPSDPGATAEIGPIPQGLLIITVLQWALIAGSGIPALALLWYGIQRLRQERQPSKPFTFRY